MLAYAFYKLTQLSHSPVSVSPTWIGWQKHMSKYDVYSTGLTQEWKEMASVLSSFQLLPTSEK